MLNVTINTVLRKEEDEISHIWTTAKRKINSCKLKDSAINSLKVIWTDRPERQWLKHCDNSNDNEGISLNVKFPFAFFVICYKFSLHRICSLQ